MNKIMECLVRFAGCNRYMAHSKIDDALRQFPRDGQRNWHHSLVQSGPDTFSGVIRTTSPEVANALAQAKWKEIAMPSPGQACTAVIEVAPKKIAQYSAFRRPEFALEFARKRLIESGAFDDLQVEHLSHSFFAVEKPGNSYSGPTAWFEVRGKAKDQQAMSRLMTQGIGGSHAFGIGLLNLSTSALYPIAQAVAMARREARPALQFLT
jgi:hypothetical protein